MCARLQEFLALNSALFLSLSLLEQIINKGQLGGGNVAGSWCDDDVTMRVWSICLKARQSRRQTSFTCRKKEREDRDRAGDDGNFLFLLNHFSLMASLNDAEISSVFFLPGSRIISIAYNFQM